MPLGNMNQKLKYVLVCPIHKLPFWLEVDLLGEKANVNENKKLAKTNPLHKKIFFDLIWRQCDRIKDAKSSEKAKFYSRLS